MLRLDSSGNFAQSKPLWLLWKFAENPRVEQLNLQQMKFRGLQAAET